ncbi:MAG: hypothetical protein IPM18_06375 [Phycisphaerales bacterium]|nr:hypothetical protein [Phycisphaerales bacterium]
MRRPTWKQRLLVRLARSLAVRVFPQHDRSFRTIALLAALAVFNAVDLALTQIHASRGNFEEANLLAQPFIDMPGGLTLYKLVLFGLGAFVLYRFRRCWQSEAALWGLVICFGGLMFWWYEYLVAFEICLQDPAIGLPWFNAG